MHASVVVILAVLSVGQSRPNATSSMGTNLGPLKYWTTEWVFTDAFKQSSPWITACVATQQGDCSWGNAWDTGEESLLDLDADGWVRSLPEPGDAPTFWLARSVMFYGIDGHFPAGQYVVRYDGEGTINYSGSATKNLIASGPGRDVLDVVPGRDGIILELAATDPNHTGNYVRNIHVLMPGYESSYVTQPFHPTFLSSIERFKLIRFMMWMETQASLQSTWAGRPHTTDARYSTSAGAPLETMVALANTVGADAWFNIPHMATDDYITQFANTVHANLGSSQKVYVEYSNEVWNSAYGFDQSRWVAAQGAALWPSSSESAFSKQMNWFGMRTAQMCDLFKAAWGADRGRVVCVLGSQAASSWTASQAADCPLWTAGAPCHAHGIDAIASAPYMDVRIDDTGNRARLTAMVSEADHGLNSLFAELQTGGVLPSGYAGGSIAETIRRATATTAVATARNLVHIAYEGGQHLADLTSNQADIQDLFRRLNRDPRMAQVYDAYLAGWRASGGRLFVHYLNTSAYGVYGPFGAREWLGQPLTPKADSIARFLTNNPEWWGTGTPAPVVANNPVPTLSSISPTQVTAGAAGFTLTLNGTNLLGSSTVRFGTTTLVSTRVSGSRLTAVVPQALLGSAAAINVTVSNATPGGGTTSAQVFNVYRPLYYSIRNATLSITGVGTVANEDIVRYDRVTNTKTLFFDGSVASSVLGAANVDAFFINQDGTVLLSFDARVTIPSMAGATVAEPADVVLYNPQTRAWTFYFDGSDVGLTTATENIDGLALLPDGRMLISTSGAASVPGVAAAGGEDIIAFSPTGLGANTTGTWAMLFDGSSVGLSGTAENIDAIAPMGDGTFLFSTTGAAAVNGGLRFTGDDFVRFVPTALGSTTAGTFSLWLTATTAVISGGIDGLQY